MKARQWMVYTLLALGLLLTEAAAAPNENNANEPAKTVTVEIKGFKYSPAEVTLAPGTRVVWINRDTPKHNVVFDNKVSSPLLAKNEQWSMEFKTPGTYQYLCGPHPWMKGVIIVK